MSSEKLEKIKKGLVSDVVEEVKEEIGDVDQGVSEDDVRNISKNRTYEVLTHILEGECDSEVCNAIREKIGVRSEKKYEKEEPEEKSEEKEQEETEAEEASEKTESGDFEKIHEELKEIREGLVHEPEKEEKEEESEYEYSYQKVMDQ